MNRFYFLSTLFLFLAQFSFAQAPTNGLVAYYPFNSNAQDASGNNNHGTPQNGVMFGVDRFGSAGKAASFDGVNDLISIPDESSLNFSSSFAVSFWIKASIWGDGNNDARGIISKKANDVSAGYVFYKDGFYPNKLNFRLRGGSTNMEYMPSHSNVLLNVWEFWTMIYNSSTGTVKIHKNGLEEKSYTVSSSSCRIFSL